MISPQNTTLAHLGADLRQPGPVATIMGAVNLLDAVMAERRKRLLSTLGLVASVTQHMDLENSIPLLEPADV